MMVADSASGVGALLAIYVVFWFVSGFIGMAIGASKGRAGAGFALGLFLGFIGWIIAACLSKSPQKQAQEYMAVQQQMHLMGGANPYAANVYATPQPIAQPASHNPPGWHADPFSRHQYRYWDGWRWTEQVADHGHQSTDPPIAR